VLYVRHMAWLNAVPRPAEGASRARADVSAPKLSRAAQMRANGIRNPLMPPNPLPHVIDRLLEVGLSEAAGMGVGPVSWLTIDAWRRQTGAELMPWEARLIRRLSIEYVAEQRRAESENCPPPWRWEVTEAEKKAEVASLRSIFV
jgi:hypothetical protein